MGMHRRQPATCRGVLATLRLRSSQCDQGRCFHCARDIDGQGGRGAQFKGAVLVGPVTDHGVQVAQQGGNLLQGCGAAEARQNLAATGILRGRAEASGACGLAGLAGVDALVLTLVAGDAVSFIRPPTSPPSMSKVKRLSHARLEKNALNHDSTGDEGTCCAGAAGFEGGMAFRCEVEVLGVRRFGGLDSLSGGLNVRPE